MSLSAGPPRAHGVPLMVENHAARHTLQKKRQLLRHRDGDDDGNGPEERRRPNQLILAKYAAAASSTTTGFVPAALTNEHSRLSLQLLRAIADLQLSKEWIKNAEHYTQSDDTVNAAMRAFVAGGEYRLRQDNASALVCSKRTAEALGRLRRQLAPTDASLLAIALLLGSTTLTGGEPMIVFNHVEGMRIILEEKRKAGPLSDLARTQLWSLVNVHFSLSITLAQVSPYDRPEWLSMSASAAGEDVALTALRGLGFHLAAQLPRLVLGIRSIREQLAAGNLEVDSSASTELVDQLLNLRDKEAESQILHRVSLVATSIVADAAKEAAMPYEYVFKSYDEHEVAVHYWYYRLMVINIHMALERLPLKMGPVASEAIGSASLRDEQERLVANLIMAWQSTDSNVGRASAADMLAVNPRAAQEALVAIWAALAGRTRFRGKPASVARTWVLQRMQAFVQSPDAASVAEHLDEAAQVLEGGPIKGIFFPGVMWMMSMMSGQATPEEIAAFVKRQQLSDVLRWNAITTVAAQRR